MGSIWRFRIVFRGACWQLWLGWAMGTLINDITFLKSSADPGGSSPLCSLKWDQEMSSRYRTPSLVCLWVESFNDREITPSVVTSFSWLAGPLFWIRGWPCTNLIDYHSSNSVKRRADLSIELCGGTEQYKYSSLFSEITRLTVWSCLHTITYD